MSTKTILSAIALGLMLTSAGDWPQSFAEQPALWGAAHFARNPNFARSGRWRPDRSAGVELFGFYERESVEGRSLVWSQHCASIYLPLYAGRYRIVIEWEAVRYLDASELIMLEFPPANVPIQERMRRYHRLG